MPAIPVTGPPCPFEARPEKFTTLGTIAERVEEAGCCAFTHVVKSAKLSIREAGNLAMFIEPWSFQVLKLDLVVFRWQLGPHRGGNFGLRRFATFIDDLLSSVRPFLPNFNRSFEAELRLSVYAPAAFSALGTLGRGCP